MENRKLIYLFGMIFSIVFAAFYFFIFNNFITNEERATKTVYFNQVGLYKEEANSTKMIETLKTKELEAFSVNKGDIIAVVCTISEDESQIKAQQEVLTSMGLNYIEKQVNIAEPDILSLLENKEFAKALEMMDY